MADEIKQFGGFNVGGIMNIHCICTDTISGWLFCTIKIMM